MVHKLGWLVEDYGAVGNGSTDTADAFTGLVAGMGTRVANTERQVCYLQPKTYNVNRSIVINQKGICLEGQDPIGSVIRGSASLPADSPVIDITGGTTQLVNVELNNLTVTRVNPGPLVRLGGVLCATLAGLILSNGNPYVRIHKPNNPANLHVVLDRLDCAGGQAAVGIDAAAVDHLCISTSRIACNGSGSIAVRVATGARPVLFDVGALNFATYWHLRSITGIATMIGGWADTAVTAPKWIDDEDNATKGVVIGRKWTTRPPLGTWGLNGPTHNI